MEQEHSITVKTDQPVRVDRYLAEAYPHLSRSFLQKRIKDGAVTVNAGTAKAGEKVKDGDVIRFSLPEPQEPEARPVKMDLDIVYEDDQLLVVNKPQGMVVHPAPGHTEDTLVNGLLYHCRGQLSGINGVLRPGIVHRIDRDTSGLLVVCKTDEAHRHIARQLADHTITRRYRAIVHGVFQEPEGTVAGTIGRHPVDRKKMAVGVKNGKPAVTHYRLLQTYEKFSYIECRLETGRTHQIRVHMASIHHPVLGDPVYSTLKSPFRLSGQALHAMVLGFVHPVTGQYMEFQAPLPAYFQHLLEVL